jgi:hypothetical protein
MTDINAKPPIYLRKLKPIGKVIKPGEVYLHPVTLELRVNKDKYNLVATQPYYNPDIKNFVYEYEYDRLKKNNNIDLKKFMSLPYLNLDINYMLYLYNINDIDDLTKWLDKEINSKTEYTFINRLLNIWIKYHLENLQKNSNILVSIYMKIGNNYWTKYINKISESEIKKYIDNWINNIDVNDYFFDLGNDLKKHIKNKT